MDEHTPNQDKLDIIIEHLENIDRRDRLRTWGGFFRGIISIIPVLVLLWSVWYTFAHGPEILEMITKKAAEQAASVTVEGATNFQEQLKGLLPQ